MALTRHGTNPVFKFDWPRFISTNHFYGLTNEQNTPFWMSSSYKRGTSFRLPSTHTTELDPCTPYFLLVTVVLRLLIHHGIRIPTTASTLLRIVAGGLCPINFWLDPDIAFPATGCTYLRRRGCTTTILAGRNGWTWQGLKRECSLTLTFNPMLTGIMALELHTIRVFELDKFIH